jgi:hypothetical protein
VVANYAAGRPVWLMLIGPPGCGKSELLNSLLSLPGIVEGGAITGVGALLSGSKKRERTAASTGGLLREIGDRGALVIKEFTSILSLPNETLRSLLAAFREVYDGRWTRPVGSDGGSREHWEGKCAVFTGSTETIDHHHELIADMGERFLFYRYDGSDGWSEAYNALGKNDREDLSECLQKLLVLFSEELSLDWTSPIELPPLDSHDKQRVVAFAQFAAHGRSAVARDRYTHEVIQASTGEYPTRIALALGKMLAALRYIGVDEEDSWRILRKCSFDSLPGARRNVLNAILNGSSSTSEIADLTHVSQSTVRRSLEELHIHSLVARTDVARWSISDWAKERLREGMNGYFQN